MIYKYPTISELSFILIFGDQGTKAYIAAKSLKRSAKTIYRSLDAGHSITEYHENYKANKSKADRKPITLPSDDLDYIKEKVALFLTSDTIVGRNEKAISYSMHTFYHIFKRSKDIDVTSLLMKGKRYPNSYMERRGKAGRLGRAITERYKDYPN